MTPYPGKLFDSALDTNASLLDRLRDLDDAESWNRFYVTYARVVHGLARRRGLTDAESEDVAQEVFKRIADTIQTFEITGRPGSFRSWLFQLVRWRADDKLRERERQPDNIPFQERSRSTLGSSVLRTPPPMDADQALETEARRQLLHAALERLKHRLNPRDLQIFHLLAFDDWPVRKVARFFRLTSASVYVIRHRVGRQLRQEISSLEKRLHTQ